MGCCGGGATAGDRGGDRRCRADDLCVLGAGAGAVGEGGPECVAGVEAWGPGAVSGLWAGGSGAGAV